MSLVRDVLKEVLGMFLADAGLSLAVLAVVAIAAALANLAAAPLAAGGVLLFGSLAALIASARHGAGARR